MNKSLEFLLFLLQPLGFLYGLIMKLRCWLYQNGFFSSIKPDALVISVGNLTMGGSGKTPVVIYLSDLLMRKGFRVAAISRGYRGTAPRPYNVVSNGINILMNAEKSGDEPRLIAEMVPGLVVITGKKRIHPCSHAIQEYNCNTLILDDAFQHLSVKRDIDIVLFNADTLFKNMKVFPSGYLRESLSALRRADCFIISGCNNSNLSSVNKFSKYLNDSFPDNPIFCNHNIAQCLIDNKNNSYSLSQITEPVLAFCGIASPLRFKTTLQDNSIDPVDFITFNDHQEYSPLTIKKIENRANLIGCRTLITTTKDMVKLKNIKSELNIYALKMEVKFDSSFDPYIFDRLSHSTNQSKHKQKTYQKDYSK